ncbi:unnamed protein product [Spirodela intermedia]|uniref:very-long-chain 3-oxoacyl-CoA synthase n=1 Tax=Spirodela intermedia TaxID=51605 RepID=A0A7I8IQL4_SPIIN|nr:unnamed protein product [Spirodela intermedia]CAA6659422.1 unnamed protein product [Spirodela intermedia]
MPGWGSVAALRRLLVEHPSVAAFEWDERRTWGASPLLIFVTIFSYLALVLFLRRLLPPRPSPHPPLRLILRFISPVHNAVILFLSLTMAIGCSLAAASQMPSPTWVFCFPPGETAAKGPVFFYAHIFYLSKIYELVDTLLILLSSDGRRLSFLHVYHHAVVLIMSRLWITAKQSLMPVALVTNASVHVVMYGYYLCSSLGVLHQLRSFSGLSMAPLLQGGCSGMGAWLFNAAFNGSLLFLFLDFHKSNYRSTKKRDARKRN